MPINEDLANRIRTCLKGKHGITSKNMFGGLCFLHQGNMLCGIDNRNRLMLRVGAEQYQSVLAMQHVREMDFTGKPLTGMVYVDEKGFTTDAKLKEWIDHALAFTRTLDKKR